MLVRVVCEGVDEGDVKGACVTVVLAVVIEDFEFDR